jgi:hypothetical protein
VFISKALSSQRRKAKEGTTVEEGRMREAQ